MHLVVSMALTAKARPFTTFRFSSALRTPKETSRVVVFELHMSMSGHDSLNGTRKEMATKSPIPT